MDIVETTRLRIRTISLDDADVAFHLALQNDPAFIEHIGDRGLRTLEDSRKYIAEGPVAMQEKHGHSMYLVELKYSGTPIGMCGLIKRDFLEDVDIGYAFLPQYRGCGYAYEAGRVVVDHARAIGITRLAGITNPSNVASNQLLQKLGLRFKCLAYLRPDDPGTNLYIADLLDNAAAA
jgi:RimJ/RimL family protein N-acetyltransferase